MKRPDPSPPVWDRYIRTEGRVHLTGLQALARLTLDQVRRDRAEGRRVGVLISGYPGSPLAGFDQLLGTLGPLMLEHDVRLLPGLNEELAASTVAGTQLFERFPHSQYDGVVGIWYGKAPGLDRSLDAIRHSNFNGTSRSGGVLAVVGDDPACKSSSLPSHSEHAFAHAFVPLLSPADAGEVLELGLHGIALSRYSGLWVGLRVVADVADGGGILTLPEVSPELPKLEIAGKPFRPRVDTRLLPPHVNRIEEEIVLERLEAVRVYAQANSLNRIVGAHPGDRIGLVASGWLFPELLGGLERLGIGERELEELGVRLLKISLLYPFESETLRRFADGLEQIVVLDDRRGFLEDQIKTGLATGLDTPQVIGQRKGTGEPWLAALKELTADRLAVELGAYLAESVARPELGERAKRVRNLLEPSSDAISLVRSPHFCSGCPHSVSTQLPQGSVAGGGIGCHTMALLMDRGVEFIGAMGSEGAHWIGLSPFVDTPHLFQNLGDGTYFHSGRLAVRAAVEAGVRMTFKLLYNGRIAMTGGQQAVGGKPVAQVVLDLLSDGVRRIIAVSPDPELRRIARRLANVECVSRRDYEGAMRRLRGEPGVTALVYDELCANEKQRLQRRGLLPRPSERVLINEDVCEGCGDCGARSACLSLHPLDTPLGRKTRIHQSSCSDDRTCIEGDCPSFLTVETPLRPRPDLESCLPEEIPEPVPHRFEEDPYRLLLVGIGSTGVVTVNALLMRAAEIEGLNALHLDQTGLSQRGGRVVSHCVLGRGVIRDTARVGAGLADAMLAFDPIGSTDASALRAISPERTHAVTHRKLSPTADMLTDFDLEVPSLDDLTDRITRHTREQHVVPSEALAEAVFGTSLPSNVIHLGFACQVGAVPLSPASLERAIADRGIAVDQNVAALRLGRAVAADPGLIERLLSDEVAPTVAERREPEEAAALGLPWTEIERMLRESSRDRIMDLLPRLAGFALDLVDYQNRAYARRYLESLLPIVRAAQGMEEGEQLIESGARELYRLMAYKDEYEVARLLVRGPFRRWLERRSEGPLQLRYHLHPPLLRALGLDRKLALGRWVEPLLRVLVSARWLRGTPLDPFGRTACRRLERELVSWYEGVLDAVARHLDPATRGRALEIVSAPSAIRGFEELKLRRAADVRRRVASDLAELTGPRR